MISIFFFEVGDRLIVINLSKGQFFTVYLVCSMFAEFSLASCGNLTGHVVILNIVSSLCICVHSVTKSCNFILSKM